jgi:NADH:ubiquinone oxidoreductase subunit H
MLQIMAYEPMVILTIVGMYMVTKSFNVIDIACTTNFTLTCGNFLVSVI